MVKSADKTTKEEMEEMDIYHFEIENQALKIDKEKKKEYI